MSTSDTDPVERLVFECLERLDTEGTDAVERVAGEHPEFADDVRREMQRLQQAGLVSGLAPPSDDAFPEQLGDFRLIERLGGGGMGVVYVAEQVSLGRRVAVKLVRPELLYFPGQRERLRREVDAVARMRHPGIVPIHAVGEDAGIAWFAMELVEGCTLEAVLDALRGRRPETLTGQDLRAVIERLRRGDDEAPALAPTPAIFEGGWVETCLRLTRQVAEALDHAHGRGVVHRDVKPSNIAVTHDGRAMLLDFGLAATQGTSRLTRTGNQPGSLPYMSPEQVRGERDVDARTDVYSLGVTLCEVLSLRPAFTDETTEILRRNILEGAAISVRRHNRHVSKDVETVCLTAMDRDPARRYASAAALAADIGHALALQPVEACRAGALRRVRLGMRRHTALAAAALAIGTAAVAWAGWSVWQRHDREQQVAGALDQARALAARGRLDEAIDFAGQALGVQPGSRKALELRDGLLQESRAQAERALDELLGLSDVKRLRDLVTESDALLPAVPDALPAVREWLVRADALLANRARHDEALQALRQRFRSGVDAHNGHWEFDDQQMAWRQDVLVELTGGLARLADIAARARDDVARVGAIEARTLTGSEATRRWAEASADVARLPLYSGLRLTPQAGLLPLWRNPRSGLWEFAELLTGEPPALDADSGRVLVTDATGLVLVLLPGGTASIGSYALSDEHPAGSPLADPWHRANEQPIEHIGLAPFFMSKFEMTQAQWRRATGNNPSFHTPPLFSRVSFPETCPVESVSWSGAARCLERLHLQLPTDAQWEYACRAGTTSVYSTGDSLASLQGSANIAGAMFAKLDYPTGLPFDADFEDGFFRVAPVGSLALNPWGLHDMHGNVWEWCLDIAETPLEGTSRRSGDGLTLSSDGPRRSSRGGSYQNVGAMARSATRSLNLRDAQSADQGLRPARSLGD